MSPSTGKPYPLVLICSVWRVARSSVYTNAKASAIRQDTARPEVADEVVRFAVDTYGALHNAVNNAGIGGAQAPRARRTLRPGIASSTST